jgi:hypothetical protein
MLRKPDQSDQAEMGQVRIVPLDRARTFITLSVHAGRWVPSRVAWRHGLHQDHALPHNRRRLAHYCPSGPRRSARR